MTLHRYWIAFRHLFRKKTEFWMEGQAENRRLISNGLLSVSDFHQIARKHGAAPIRAQKIGKVAAYQTDKEQMVETLWNGKETKNIAKQGDWVVTNLSPDGKVIRDADGNKNVYVISKSRFPELYSETDESSADDGKIYQSDNKVLVLPFPGGFDLIAPWGERQTGEAGYLLLNNEDVYANSKGTFEQTYKIL